MKLVLTKYLVITAGALILGYGLVVSIHDLMTGSILTGCGGWIAGTAVNR